MGLLNANDYSGKRISYSMSKLTYANKLGSLLNSWGKLIIGAIVSCTIAYYMILQNKEDISKEKKATKERIKTLENRHQNRHDRGVKRGDKFEDLAIKYNDRLRAVEIDNAYMKGYMEGKKQLTKTK